MFPIARSRLQKSWNRSFARLGYDAGPMHVARHVGPSEDARGTAAHGPYRTQLQIQHRGRWKPKTSTLRHAKTHTLLKAEAHMPVRLMQYGAAWLRKFGERAPNAML